MSQNGGASETMASLTHQLATYRELLAHQTELMVQVDVQGRFLYVSESYCQLFGREPEELKGTEFMALVHPDDQAATAQAMQELYRPPHSCYLEQRAMTSLGWRWLAWRDRAICDDQGQVQSIIGTAVDITEQKLALMALSQSEERYRQLFEHIPDAFCLQETVVDEQGKPCDNRILAVNPAFERLMGMSRQDMVGRRVRELFPSIEDYWVTTFGQVALSGMSTVLEDFSDVGERWYRISAYCPRRGQFAAFISDVTEEHRQAEARRQLDQQIQQTQRLESLGLLAGGVAHDFNNILMAIVGHAELLSNRLPAETPGREHLEHIYNAAQRAAELCKQMLAYAGKSSHIKEAIDLGALVREMVGFITTAIKSQARLELAIDDDLPTVNVDPSQIRQVLMNLIMNASDALPDSNGLIKVSLSRNDCSATYVASTELHGDLEPGAYLCLAVSDNGCGIDPEVRKRIFEPFYTTKSQGRGLGLAAILGIARAHSGGMRLSSEVGRGSTFELLLPLEQQPSPSMGEHGPAAGPSLHSGGVLLINTEADFGQVGEAMLRSLGYQVMLASDLHQALQLHQQQRSNIDALVVGRCVDGVAGITLLQDLREQGVASPCVLVSADDEEDADDMAPLLRQLGVVAVLPKPCTVLELRAAMRRINGDQRSF